MPICILSSCVGLKNEWEKIQLLHVWQIKDICYSKCHGMEKWLTFFHYNFSKNKCSMYYEKKYPGNINANDTWYFKTKKSCLKQILVSKQLWKSIMKWGETL